jgi:hypothetical protein
MSFLHKTKYDFNFQAHMYFWIFTKMFLFKIVHPLKIYQHTKFQGTSLIDASFALYCHFKVKSFNNVYG